MTSIEQEYSAPIQIEKNLDKTHRIKSIFSLTWYFSRRQWHSLPGIKAQYIDVLYLSMKI